MSKSICLTCLKKAQCPIYESTKKTKPKIIKCKDYKGAKKA